MVAKKDPEEEMDIGDVFPQYKGLDFDFNGVASNLLQETPLNTEVNMFSDKAWLIHEIEFDLSEIFRSMASEAMATAIPAGGDIMFSWGRPGMAGGNDLNTPGVIGLKRFTWHGDLNTQGQTVGIYNSNFVWVPPGGVVPYASRTLAFYAQASADVARFVGNTLTARVAFTMIKTTSKLWKELAERWHLQE